jgi:DNA polymerase-3 subunit epsilon
MIPTGKFLAIDFETADRHSDSACAIGLVKVENNVIVDRKHYLIKPPRRYFQFTYIHGITWDQVRNQPTFAELWPVLQQEFADDVFMVAHNARFDAYVLSTCCRSANIKFKIKPFLCTMILARRVWRLFPTKLPDVCRFLRIDLNHHNALSDAEACARIVIEARNKLAKR